MAFSSATTGPGREKRRPFLAPGVVSIILNLAAVLMAGAALQTPSPRLVRLSVDLRLSAPPLAGHQNKIQSRAVKAPPEPEKPASEPELKTKPAPNPSPRLKPAARIKEKSSEPAPSNVETEETEAEKPEPLREPASGESGQETNAAEEDSSGGAAGKRSSSALEAYSRLVYEKIFREREYPPASRVRREEGAPVVRFTISQDGSLEAVELIESSGHPRLDRAALFAVRRAAPFPPLPEELGLSSLTLVLPVEFRLRFSGP